MKISLHKQLTSLENYIRETQDPPLSFPNTQYTLVSMLQACVGNEHQPKQSCYQVRALDQCSCMPQAVARSVGRAEKLSY